MIRLAALILLFFLSYHMARSQEAFYKHFEGKVGTNISVVVDMVKSGTRLSGYYYYYFDDKSGDTSWIHYGKSMPIAGTIENSQFEFSEFDPEVKGAVFRGLLENGTIDGTWTSSDGKKQLPVQMIEKYPLGTMSFSAVYLNETAQLFEQKASPRAAIEVSMLNPSDYPLRNVEDSVRVNIYDHFFDTKNPSGKPDSLLLIKKELYFSNYRKSNEDLYKEGDASFDWQKIKEVRILHNEKDVLSLEYFDYGFTGGAHGLSLSNFHVIDLKNGRQILLDEVFRDDYTNDLRDIINSAARKKYRLERNQPLTDAGFFVAAIDPTSNFYITKDGMGFYYNQYEVAPFALGPIEIFVSYKDLLRILRDESPVHRLISNGK
jgi:hypothetical protein